MDNNEFECLLDEFSNILMDIKDAALRSNLMGILDSLYCVYEQIDLEELDRVKNENEIMLHILEQVLSYEQKQYVRIKYDIDIGYNVMGEGVMI